MLLHRWLKLVSLPGYQEEQKSFPGRKETQEQPAPAEAVHTVETPQNPHTTEPDTNRGRGNRNGLEESQRVCFKTRRKCFKTIKNTWRMTWCSIFFTKTADIDRSSCKVLCSTECVRTWRIHTSVTNSHYCVFV